MVAYGAEGLRLPPQRMRAFRLPLAQTIGWQRGGNLDTLFDQDPRMEDPSTTAIVRHLTTFQRLVHSWPLQLLADLEEAWEKGWQKLTQAVHPWRVAYGPMQATMCYLLQMGWQAPKLFDWRHYDEQGHMAWSFSLKVSKWELEGFFKKFLQSAAHQRMSSTVPFTVKPEPFDWTVSHRMRKGMTKLPHAALLAWHQGSLRHAQNCDMSMCPVCQQPLTLRHLLWECRWVNEKCRAIPEGLQEHFQDLQNEEIWLRGWVHLPPMPRRFYGAQSLEGSGAWAQLECIDHEEHYAYGIATSLVGKDKRTRQMVVAFAALVVTAQGVDEFREIGYVTALVAEPHAAMRGYLQGLTMLIQHMEGQCRVGIPNEAVVKLWKQGVPFTTHTDLLSGVSHEWHQQIRLYGVNEKKETRGWRSPQDKWAHQRAKAVAKNRARVEQELQLEQRLAAGDDLHQQIYELAIERVSTILQHKDHFLAGKTKKQASKGVTNPKRERSPKRLSVSSRFFHQADLKGMFGQRIITDTSALCVEWACILHNPGGASRAAIQGGVVWDEQQDRPQRGNVELAKHQFFELLVTEPQQFGTPHTWQWTEKATGISCTQCRAWMGKAFAWTSVKATLANPCKSTRESPPKNVKLHSSHQMLKKGQQWECQVCQGSMMWKEDRWHLQSKLQKACVRRANANQLDRYFGSQARNSGVHSNPASQTLLPTSEEDGCVEVEFF